MNPLAPVGGMDHDDDTGSNPIIDEYVLMLGMRAEDGTPRYLEAGEIIFISDFATVEQTGHVTMATPLRTLQMSMDTIKDALKLLMSSVGSCITQGVIDEYMQRIPALAGNQFSHEDRKWHVLIASMRPFMIPAYVNLTRVQTSHNDVQASTFVQYTPQKPVHIPLKVPVGLGVMHSIACASFWHRDRVHFKALACGHFTNARNQRCPHSIPPNVSLLTLHVLGDVINDKGTPHPRFDVMHQCVLYAPIDVTRYARDNHWREVAIPRTEEGGDPRRLRIQYTTPTQVEWEVIGGGVQPYAMDEAGMQEYDMGEEVIQEYD